MAPPADLREAELSYEQRRYVDALLSMTAGSDTLDVRVGDVVDAAGGCRAAFYRSFESKDELLLATIHETARRISAAVWRQLPPEPSPRELITAWVATVLRPAAGAAPSELAPAFALDRHRLARQFSHQTERAMAVLTAPLSNAVVQAGAPQPALVVEAIAQMVMAMVASRLATGTRLDGDDVDTVVRLSCRLAGLDEQAA